MAACSSSSSTSSSSYACSCSSYSSSYLVLLPAVPRTHASLSLARFHPPGRIKGLLLGRHHLRLFCKLSDGRETQEKVGTFGFRGRNGSGSSSMGSGFEGNGRKGGTLRGRGRREEKDTGFGPSVVVEDVRKDAKRGSLKNLVRKMVRKRSERGFSENGGVGMGDGSSLRQGKEGNLKLGSKLENLGGRGSDDDDGVEKVRDSKRSRKSKVKTPAMELRVVLDRCSKMGDFMAAIRAYDWARKEGIDLEQYHYAVVLYLCASAATGVVRPAKSGSGIRTLNSLELSDNSLAVETAHNADSRVSGTGSSICSASSSSDAGEMTDAAETKSRRRGDDSDSRYTFGGNGNTYENPSRLQDLDDILDNKSTGEDFVNSANGAVKQERQMILLDENDKKYALERGIEIYKDMRLDKIPMNEAVLTSVARMAMSTDDGDMAFSMVNEMISLGINPKLRSYGPALLAFSNGGDLKKAFEVEKHMLDHGIEPEEPELQALLKVSIAAGNGEKVYYLLHKLRTSSRKVTPDTANLIEQWFSGPIASKLGKSEWDVKEIKGAMEYGGGGWHGKGWLGKGNWKVSRTTVDSNGFCRCCGEKLALIDLDPVETEKFAQSVASIAIKREKNSFEKFQKWLNYHGPFEAIIDGANVGLFSQSKFMPTKINMVANGIRQKLPSKRWPLIVLHNKRVMGGKMDEPVNKSLVEKWRNADALYATPTGSNDDWFWLYAAIKFRSLIVTNDEMRDHIFQILGNDFFPKWKERHQVRFSFSDTGPVFHMPPPCSIVIQESEYGHWHIPLSAEQEYEEDRTWLCVRRDTCLNYPGSGGVHSNLGLAPEHCQVSRSPDETELTVEAQENHVKEAHPEAYQELKNIVFASVLERHESLVSDLEAAEALGNCTIDFQI
ncbi:hypothetical protein MLD38_014351 [Melastoma candidum]|uniref:Uncharacterized protein n=1 Tax=Melastoma candidum TaxID=119954 RepID=A0ACB9RG73_9MYRT|nr:hypothetical protein MLD38_014351 [Melastoma candidum]